MSFAEDTGRLRREIEEMRGARMALKKRLNRFAMDLRRSINEQRSAMRKRHADQAAKTRAALASFVAHNQRSTRESLGGFQRERNSAHRAWMKMAGGAGARKTG